MSTILHTLRSRIAGAIAPRSAVQAASSLPVVSYSVRIDPVIARPAAARPPQTRMYHAAKSSRLTAGWARSTSSADSELTSSL